MSSVLRPKLSILEKKPGERFQFERQGYFVRDKDSMPGKPGYTQPLSRASRRACDWPETSSLR